MEKEIAIQLKHIDFYQREEYKKHLIKMLNKIYIIAQKQNIIA